MTIDEAIAREREKAKEIRENIIDKNNLEPYESYCIAMTARCAEEHEQLAEWLEELKDIKSDEFTDDLLNMGFTKGYNKALDDFVKFASDMPTVETEDGTIRPMWLEEMAERLKGQNK